MPKLPQSTPDLVVGSLRIWIHGYQFPDAADDWDSNWIRLTASYVSAGGAATISGSILDTVSFGAFTAELLELHRSLAGEATLSSVEPNFYLQLSASNSHGGIAGRLLLSSDHLSEEHSFTFEYDQSYIPALLEQLRSITDAYPVRGKRSRRV